MAAGFDQSVDYFERVQRVTWYERLIEDFLRFVDVPARGRLLDVGCGPGLLTRKVSRHVSEAVGVDHSDAMIKRAREIARGSRRLHYEVGDAAAIPFPDDQFDVVTATSVLYLLSDQRRALEEMMRAVKPGGAVASMEPSVEMRPDRVTTVATQRGITGFDFEALLGWMKAANYHGALSLPDLMRIYERVGLKDTKIQSALDGLVLMAKATK